MSAKEYHQRLLITAGVLVALGGAAGCDGGSPDPTGPPVAGATVNESLVNIGPWETFSPTIPSFDSATAAPDPTKEVVSDQSYACTTTPYSMAETPSKIAMYSPNASIMWAGNLIQGRSYRDGLGSLQELSIRQRAPLKISIDLLSADNFAIVDNPSLTSVDAAIGALIERAHDSGHRAGSSIEFDKKLTHSIRQSALRLGLSAYYLGSSVEASLDSERNASKRTLTAHFVQKMFTVRIELPQNPGDFFSSDFTAEVLATEQGRGNLGPSNPPVYIANIVYGRMLTYSLTSSDSEEQMRAAINASYNGVVGGGDGYLESELRSTLSQENIKVQTIGGDGEAALRLISSGELAQYFDQNAPLISARPLSYQLNNLSDNRIAKVSETTSYNLKECSPLIDVTSNFDDNTDDGWTGLSGTISSIPVTVHNTVHRSGGHSLYTSGNNNWFRAPDKYLNDKSSYYGGSLNYWYLWSNQAKSPGVVNGSPDVVITGRNGVAITHDHAGDPINTALTWQFFSHPIDDASGWKVQSTGAPATQADIEGVLQDVADLQIRATKRNVNDTNHYIDEIELKG